jgi:hypothetical protein
MTPEGQLKVRRAAEGFFWLGLLTGLALLAFGFFWTGLILVIFAVLACLISVR